MLIKLTYDVVQFIKRVNQEMHLSPRDRFLNRSVDLADFECRLKEWERRQDHWSSLSRMPYWNH